MVTCQRSVLWKKEEEMHGLEISWHFVNLVLFVCIGFAYSVDILQEIQTWPGPET